MFLLNFLSPFTFHCIDLHKILCDLFCIVFTRDIYCRFKEPVLVQGQKSLKLKIIAFTHLTFSQCLAAYWHKNPHRNTSAWIVEVSVADNEILGEVVPPPPLFNSTRKARYRYRSWQKVPKCLKSAEKNDKRTAHGGPPIFWCSLHPFFTDTWESPKPRFSEGLKTLSVHFLIAKNHIGTERGFWGVISVAYFEVYSPGGINTTAAHWNLTALHPSYVWGGKPSSITC